jgi:hypothetical protein
MACGRGCCSSFKEHIQSLRISPSVYNPNVGKQNTYDRKLSADRDAYKRMRDEGLQPATMRGSADLEARATSKYEIARGKAAPAWLAKRLDAANTEAQQITAAAA